MAEVKQKASDFQGCIVGSVQVVPCSMVEKRRKKAKMTAESEVVLQCLKSRKKSHGNRDIFEEQLPVIVQLLE